MKQLKTLSLIFVAVLLPVFLCAQRILSGKVTDAVTGEDLIGATVQAVGTTIGAISDVEGNYKFRVPEGTTQIRVAYTGYIEQILPLPPAGTDVLNFQLTTNNVLTETLIIGYGTVKREDATGLVQSVSTESFNRGAITGPQELLAGKVAGVVISTNGDPGGGAKIRVRGESSLSSVTDPLIVIDGVPLADGGVSGNRNPLNIINPNDIESFTVLKDASSAAIYGNRASGGVILITTKKGKLGKKIGVGYNGNVSVGQTYNRIDVLNGDEFRAIVKARYPNLTNQVDPQELLGTENTDWQDLIYQNAFAQDHSLNVSGGIGVVPYRVSFGYTDKDGLLKTDNFKRYSTAVNLTPGFLDNRLQLNLHLKGMLSDNHFADRGAIGSALSFDPTKPVRNTTGLYGGYTTWLVSDNGGTNNNPNGLAPANPVALLELRDDNSTVRQLIANANISYRFKRIPELLWNLTLGRDYSNGQGTVVIPNFASFAFDPINGGGVNNNYEQTRTNSILETFGNYKRTFGRHDLDLMAGYSWQRFYQENNATNSNTAGTPGQTNIERSADELFLLSLYTRINYGFFDRYLLTFSLRRDATSRFAPEYRVGYFPAAAFAVKLVDRNRPYFGNIKLRTSWGLTGQQNIGDPYAYLARYELSQPNAQYPFGNTYYNTYRANGYVRDIKWEETQSFNAGLDFEVVKNRLSATFDVYQRFTSDLLSFIPVPAGSNLTNFVTDNVGKMESKGVELSLVTTPVLTKDIKWDLSANFAYNVSEITKLNEVEDPTSEGLQTGGIAGGVGSNIQRHTVGYFPASFFVFEQKYDENGNLLEGQFVDRNGDGKVDDLDKYRYQNPAPLYSLGITSNFNYGNFDFSFGARSFIGNYVYNNVQTDMGYLNRLYNSSGYLANVNRSAVDLNVVDQAKLTFSDHFVKNATFLRFDHITAGYYFNKVFTKVPFRVYATIQNPLVITKYDGLDPEIGNGIDNNTYPRPRTFLFGISANF
jgi:iron complex outermembrane receptor protein